MKEKIISLVAVALLVGLVLPGCAKGRINELEAQISELTNQVSEQEVQIAGQKTKLAEQETQITVLSENVTELKGQNYAQGARIEELEGDLTEKDAQIAKLEEEKAGLEAEIECLRMPTPQVSKETVGTITFEQLKQLSKRFFPKAMRSTGAFTKGPYPLVSLETLKEFLAKDPTNFCPVCKETSYNIGDELAFRLKDHWIRTGLPGHSLGLIKAERVTSWGKIMCWRNIFITKEDGEFAIYEVVAHTDEIIKIEEPNLEIRWVVIQDRL